MKCECGGDMKHHDKAVRIVREKGGARTIFMNFMKDLQMVVGSETSIKGFLPTNLIFALGSQRKKKQTL